MKINTHQILHFMLHFFVSKRKGHGVHSPLAYSLCENVFYNTDSFYAFKQLEVIRNGLLQNETAIEVEDFGAGSKTFSTKTRKIKDIAAKGISTKKQSELLYKLLNFYGAETCIELGTSLGLNTCYLASVNSKAKIISIEGSKTLSDFASQLAQKNGINTIEFVNAKFDEALSTILEKIKSLDFLYVDGNHTYEATLRYFQKALEKKHNGSVFIFDDIYWSADMTRVWKELKKHPAVTLSIDTFYFGMVFFDESIKEKVDLKMYI